MLDKNYREIGTPYNKLIEELGEVIQALCKAERFGLFTIRHDSETNWYKIQREMDDVGDRWKEFKEYVLNKKLERNNK